MIGVISWTVIIRILRIDVPALVKISGIWCSISSLGSGVRVEVIGLGIFSVLFALFVHLSILMDHVIMKRMQ